MQGPAPSESPFNLLWLRRNLRFQDNVPLSEALQAGLPLLPIFIFDTNILNELNDKADSRVTFIHSCLEKLNEELAPYGSTVHCFIGSPDEIFANILNSWPINSIFVAKDFEPYAVRRDTKIASLAKRQGVIFSSFTDHVVFHPNDIVNKSNEPYNVYTPYSKMWLSRFDETTIQVKKVALSKSALVQQKADLPSLKKVGFTKNDLAPGQSKIPKNFLDNYVANRDFPDKDFTSRLGVHLRFGTIGIRSLVKKARQAEDITFLKQLIWREFFIQILHHYPNSVTEAFKPKYRNMPWKYNEDYFEKWKNGMTGIPIVDAGMRELNATGFMHNRVRMIVASWLTKNLLHDWRLGERYFASKLLDFELASNVGSWQWVAGTGVDAAPYFRIFNPFTQAKKFDPESKYIKTWIPELDSMNYPPPMIDYKESRARCLDFYKKHTN